MKQVSRCPPLRYGAELSSLAMSASTISMVSQCQVSRFQSPTLALVLSVVNSVNYTELKIRASGFISIHVGAAGVYIRCTCDS